MDKKQAILKRHSVRRYTGQKLEEQTVASLLQEVKRCNEESGLHIQLVTDEPKAFSGFLAHYGKFHGVAHYFALVGKKGEDLQRKAGYYGERLVLLAQELGLNTCWVAATFGKGAVKKNCDLQPGEKLVCVIALGHGADQGTQHKSKPLASLYQSQVEVPGWFEEGMKAAALAPTAVNQQKFLFTLIGENQLKAQSTGGAYSQVDLGIVKYHFEVGAGTENFRWA